jgi:hypothetical protein
MHRIFLPVVALLLASGCSGNIVLSPLDPATLGNPGVAHDVQDEAALDKGYHGLLVYLPTQVLEIDQFTQVQTPLSDGKTLVLSGNCEKTLTQKVVTVVDRSRPYLLQYRHGFLETYTFAATLTSDGALASINTASTPDQGHTLANLSAAASSAGGLVKVLGAAQGQQPCTQTPSFVRYESLPRIPPYTPQ